MFYVTSKDGTKIAYDKLGEGPVIIMVGGAFQHRAIDPNMTHLAALLAPYFTVIHYDRRGRGDSGDTLPYTVEREVEDIEALINEVGEPAFIFGMSSGGVLALEAVVYGLNIKKLALYKPPFNIDKKAQLALDNYRKEIISLLRMDHRSDAVVLSLKTFGTPSQAIYGMRRTPVWSIFESVAPTLAYDAIIMGDGSIPREYLSSNTVPTLIINGELSPVWLHQAARALMDALPNAKHITLNGQTHEFEPEILAPILQEFFTK